MKPISKANKEKAVRLYLERPDLTVHKIASMCEMSETAMFKILQTYGVDHKRSTADDAPGQKANQISVAQAIEDNTNPTILSMDIDDQLQVTVKDTINKAKSVPVGAAEREDIMEERRFNEAVAGNNFGAIIDALNKIVVELARVQVPVPENIQPQSQVQPQTTVANVGYTSTPTGNQIAIGNIPNVEVHANASSSPELGGDVKPRAILWIL